MVEKQQNRDEEYLSYFMNKVVVCETSSGKTISGILTGYNKYELLLVEAKDIKSKKPVKTLVYKHGLVSIKETE
jgi:small nuclear ribonucleoprotein (snRNP)-like protein